MNLLQMSFSGAVMILVIFLIRALTPYGDCASCGFCRTKSPNPLFLSGLGNRCGCVCAVFYVLLYSLPKSLSNLLAGSPGLDATFVTIA